jgi:hypothetical protein
MRLLLALRCQWFILSVCWNNGLRISEEVFEEKMWVGLDLLERKS